MQYFPFLKFRLNFIQKRDLFLHGYDAKEKTQCSKRERNGIEQQGMAEEMDQEQFPVHPYTCQTERVKNNSLTLSALAFGSEKVEGSGGESAAVSSGYSRSILMNADRRMI